MLQNLRFTLVRANCCLITAIGAKIIGCRYTALVQAKIQADLNKRPIFSCLINRS